MISRMIGGGRVEIQKRGEGGWQGKGRGRRKRDEERYIHKDKRKMGRGRVGRQRRGEGCRQMKDRDEKGKRDGKKEESKGRDKERDKNGDEERGRLRNLHFNFLLFFLLSTVPRNRKDEDPESTWE